MATYKIKGSRFLRKYTEPDASPVYAAESQAQAIVDRLCDVSWQRVSELDARMTYHTDETVGEKSGLDLNVDIRDQFDAALFCAGHSGGQHRAYANAAVYRYEMPTAAVGKTVTSLKARVTSDPYNANGARIHVMTNTTGTIPTDCHACRGEDSSGTVVSDGTTASRVAVRTARTVDGKTYWYPTTADCTLSPTGGLVLQKYLFVFVLMESYSTVRGNWLEGCSFIANSVEIVTSEAVSGWTDGDTIDLTTGDDSLATVNVVKGGVYPKLTAASSEIGSVELQLDGTPLALTEKEYPARDSALYRIVGGKLSSIYGVTSDQVTLVCGMPVMTSDGGDKLYIVIGGTFAAGTFTEIPGLLLYSPTDGAFVPTQSLNDNSESGATVPTSLLTFASDHGGFSMVGCSLDPSGSYSAKQGNLLVVAAVDGASYKISGGSAGLFPVVNFGVVADGNVFGIKAVSSTTGMNSKSPELCSLLSDYASYDLEFAGAGAFLHSTSGTTPGVAFGACIPYTYLSGSTKKLLLLIPFYTATISASSNYWMSGLTSYEIEYTGEIHAVNPICQSHSATSSSSGIYVAGVTFAVAGKDITLTYGGTPYAANNAVLATVTFVKAGSGTYYVKTCAVSVPAWDATLAPDVEDGFRIFGTVDDTMSYPASFSEGFTHRALAVGGFATLGGAAHENAAYLDFTSASALTVSDCDGGSDVWGNVPGAALVCSVSPSSFVMSPLPAKAASSEKVITNYASASIAEENTAVGLRTALVYAKDKLLTAVPQSWVADGYRADAAFVVQRRSYSAKVLVDGEVQTATVNTLQLSTAKLFVSFDVPSGKTVRDVALTWTSPTVLSTGAKYNVWACDAHFDEPPAVTDFAIYDASSKTVGDWRLLGTVDASLTTVTLPMTVSGNVATLLLTAYAPIDLINPGSSVSFPQGVGNLVVDSPNATVLNANAGWRPNIEIEVY